MKASLNITCKKNSNGVYCWRHEGSRLLFRNLSTLMDIVKTMLLVFTGAKLSERHVLKEIMANHYHVIEPTHNSEYCDIKSHICDPVGVGLIQTVKNVSDNIFCQQLCNTMNRCKFTTFTFFRREPQCYLLSNCDRQVMIWKNENVWNTTLIYSVPRFPCVHPLGCVSPLKDFVLHNLRMMKDSARSWHHQDSRTMLHSGRAKEDWIPTEKISHMKPPALQCISLSSSCLIPNFEKTKEI